MNYAIVTFKYSYMKLIKKAKIASYFTTETNDIKTQSSSIYDIEINSIDGTPIYLSDLKGKILLFVNVASKCGFTKQYKDLQKLNDRYQNDLVIIGSPCNQFGNQEPGNASQIQSFCQKKLWYYIFTDRKN